MQGTERLKSCDSLKLESLQRFLSQGEVTVVNLVWICVEPGLKAAGMWSLAFNIVYCQHLK